MAMLSGVPIGQMRERVMPQTPTRTPDGAGGYTETWADLATAKIAACIRPAPAAVIERIAGGAVRAVLSYLVEVRTLSTLTLQCRLVWGTKHLAIRGMQEDRKRQRLVLACEEVT